MRRQKLLKARKAAKILPRFITRNNEARIGWRVFIQSERMLMNFTLDLRVFKRLFEGLETGYTPYSERQPLVIN